MRLAGIAVVGLVVVACGTTRPDAEYGALRDPVERSEAGPQRDGPAFEPKAMADRRDVAEAVDEVLRDGLARDLAVMGDRGLYSRCLELTRAPEEESTSSPPPGEVSAAAGHEGKSADEVARELANPNTPLATLRVKNQIRIFEGDLPNSDQTSYTMLFQPVLPFDLGTTSSGGKKVFFARPAFPFLVDQPVFDAASMDFDGKTGLGDIGFDVAYGVTEKNGLLWAVGMYGILPTASSSDLGSGHLSLGPECLLAKFYKWGLIGIFPSHYWDVAGWGPGYVNTTQVQVFLNFLPGNGWSVGSQPISSYDWRSSQWTAPVNITISKTVILGETPWKFDLEVNWYYEHPDTFGPQWMIGINVAPVVKNFIAAWLKGD